MDSSSSNGSHKLTQSMAEEMDPSTVAGKSAKKREKLALEAKRDKFYIHRNHPLFFLSMVTAELLDANPNLVQVRKNFCDLVDRNPVWKATYERSTPTDDQAFRERVHNYYQQVPFKCMHGPGMEAMDRCNKHMLSKEQRESLGEGSYVQVSVVDMLFYAYLMRQYEDHRKTGGGGANPAEAVLEQKKAMLEQIIASGAGTEEHRQELINMKKDEEEKKKSAGSINFGMRFQKGRWEVPSYDRTEMFRPTPTLENVLRALNGDLFISHNTPFALNVVLVPSTTHFHRKIFDKMLQRSPTFPTALWFMPNDVLAIPFLTQEFLVVLENTAEYALNISKETKEEVY